MRQLTVLFSLGVLLFPATADAGVIVVSGDDTPSFFLTDDFPDAANPGNRTFYANVLGGGSKVGVLLTSLSGFADNEIFSFYASLSGVTSVSAIVGAVTSANLAGLDLLIVPILDDSFSTSENLAIGTFVDGGGTLFLLREGSNIFFGTATNGRINGLLSALGSNLSISNAGLDSGINTVIGSRIVTDPLTSGVSEFKYGATSRVVGGNPLFRTLGFSTFVAYEETVQPVPEPSSLALLGIGIAGLFGYRWRRRQTAA